MDESYAFIHDVAGRSPQPVAGARTCCVFQGDFIPAHVTRGARELIVRAAMASGDFAKGAEAFLSVEPERCVLLEGALAAHLRLL
jgi:hypothetical protein